jgi:hypothetical protein
VKILSHLAYFGFFLPLLFCFKSEASEMPKELSGVFSELYKTSPQQQAEQISGAVTASPQLAKQLVNLASSGKLTQILVVPERTWGKPFNGIVDGSKVLLTADFVKSQFGGRLFDVVNDDDILPNNLVFCLGHLAYQLGAEAIDPRSFGSPQAYSAKRMQQDAGAFIQGWNDVVDAAVVSNGGKQLTPRQGGQLLMNMRYRSVFLKAIITEPKLEMLSSGLIEASAANISSIANALKTSPLADVE